MIKATTAKLIKVLIIEKRNSSKFIINQKAAIANII